MLATCGGVGSAADVHFLNSLEGGEACLLVDCYADLTDGVALEEAFFLLEVKKIPFDIERDKNSGTNILLRAGGQALTFFWTSVKVWSD